jgi:hypothetical protein
MSKLDNIQRQISRGVSGWLLFEFCCGRGLLFNEKNLSHPIGQILNSQREYATYAETNHPCDNKQTGRPLQIDLVAKHKITQDWRIAIESKWAGNTPISIKTIVWDLIRLQNLHEFHPNIHCYFVLAGIERKIQKLLKYSRICYPAKDPRPSDLTSLSPSTLTFHLVKIDDASKTWLTTKIEKYPKIKLHSKIICKPAHSFPVNDISNMSFKTYVFEVLAPSKGHQIPCL